MYGYLMLQPLIEYGVSDYLQVQPSYHNGMILYSCSKTEVLRFVPDGCDEYLIMWEREYASMLNVNKNQYIEVRTHGKFIHGIRLHPVYELVISEHEQLMMMKELSRIFCYTDRNLFIISRLSKYIRKKEMHPSTSYILEEIVQSRGRIKIEEIAHKLEYSDRHVRNLFKESFLCSPKAFCRYNRFQHVLYEMLRDQYRNNSSFIEHLSYSDQAHFQREFKIFTNMTPKEFIVKYLIK